LPGANNADLELMSELKQTCETLRPTLSGLAEECAEQDEVLNEIISAGEELSRVLDIYTAVILRGEKLPLRTSSVAAGGISLLDLGQDDGARATASNQSEADQLKEIFSSSTINEVPLNAPMAGVQLMDGPLLMDAPLVTPKIQPVLLGQKMEPPLINAVDISLPLLSPGTSTASHLVSPKEQKKSQGLDLDFLVQAQMTEGLQKNKKLSSGDESLLDLCSSASQPDDALLDLGKPESLPDLEPLSLDDPPKTLTESQQDFILTNETFKYPNPEVHKPPTATVEPQRAQEEPPVDCKLLLADLSVSLTEILPSRVPPIVVLDQPEGLHVSLHVAQNCPRPGVRVVVISILSRLSQPLDSLVCQCAVPSKVCKVRLQPPSASELPACSPFLPPPAATQLMLLANPKGVPVALKLMLSYSVDGDLVTEMGEVDQLPLDN
jgi:ADP-ribosylation factor-binding protein GGA